MSSCSQNTVAVRRGQLLHSNRDCFQTQEMTSTAQLPFSVLLCEQNPIRQIMTVDFMWSFCALLVGWGSRCDTVWAFLCAGLPSHLSLTHLLFQQQTHFTFSYLMHGWSWLTEVTSNFHSVHLHASVPVTTGSFYYWISPSAIAIHDPSNIWRTKRFMFCLDFLYKAFIENEGRKITVDRDH